MLPVTLPGAGGAVTMIEVTARWLMVPDVAVTVRVYVPAGVGVGELESAVVTVRVVLAPDAVGVTAVGLNDAVTPAGSPDTLGVTAVAKPFCEVRVTV